MQDNPRNQPREISETQLTRSWSGFGSILFFGLGATLLLPMLVVTGAAAEGAFPAFVAGAIITPLIALGATMIYHGAKRSKASLAAIGLVIAAILLLVIAAFLAGYDL